jgi:hypothetical protein
VAKVESTMARYSLRHLRSLTQASFVRWYEQNLNIQDIGVAHDLAASGTLGKVVVELSFRQLARN